jgi:hypothetical protein
MKLALVVFLSAHAALLLARSVSPDGSDGFSVIAKRVSIWNLRQIAPEYIGEHGREPRLR